MGMRFRVEETHETAAHKKSSHTARDDRLHEWNPTRSRNPSKTTRYHSVPTEFIAIDGEGVTLPDGTHRYVLLGVGDQQITNPNGLEFEEICDFLWEQFLEHGSKSVAYVGFFLGYDFVQWLRDLPEERARMLLTAEGRARRKPKSKDRVEPFPVRYGEWEFDILGSKRFKVRKQGAKRWMHICDTGPFFQKSFLKVIDPKEWVHKGCVSCESSGIACAEHRIVSPDEYKQIAIGKAKRSTAVLDRDMLRYNARENEILSRVLQRLNEGFQSLGIHLRPSQWFGPGQAASEWLDGRTITNERLKEVTPPDVLEHARESYFGGWFEITAHGMIPGITHEYDINSAYPHIISQLPCLEHGEWKHNGEPTDYTLVYAVVKGSNPYIGTMLHRDKQGNIYRPHETEGWYWHHEISAAKAAGLIDSAVISDSWSYHPCDCPPPLREVRDIYALRKEVGKTTPLGIACKLVPNSLYGKFAQSIGESPKFANPIYASLITAGCRTMILQAIATHPKGVKDVLMVATDGVYFRSPHPTLPVSGNLGDWDHGKKKDLCLFKPGVYWDESVSLVAREGKEASFKSRGIAPRYLGKLIPDIEDYFKILRREKLIPVTVKPEIWPESPVFWPGVEVPLEFAVMTASLALHQNKWERAGAIMTDSVMTVSSNPKNKRRDPYWDRNILRTRPKANDPYEPSHPYEKRFGLDDPYSLESTERFGVLRDGLPGMLMTEELKPQ